MQKPVNADGVASHVIAEKASARTWGTRLAP